MSLPIELCAGTAPRGLSVGLIPAQEGANKGGSQGQSGPEWELSNNRPTLDPAPSAPAQNLSSWSWLYEDANGTMS